MTSASTIAPLERAGCGHKGMGKPFRERCDAKASTGLLTARRVRMIEMSVRAFGPAQSTSSLTPPAASRCPRRGAAGGRRERRAGSAARSATTRRPSAGRGSCRSRGGLAAACRSRSSAFCLSRLVIRYRSKFSCVAKISSMPYRFGCDIASGASQAAALPKTSGCRNSRLKAPQPDLLKPTSRRLADSRRTG